MNAISVTVVPQKLLKVLIVMPLAEQRGGGELMLLHLLEHGRHLGVEWVVAFLADGPMVEQARGWGIETIVIRAGRLRHLNRLATTIWTLTRISRTRQIDLVFSWMGKGQLYGGSAAAIAGVPSAWYQLGLPAPAGWQDRLATLIQNRGAITCSAAATNAQSNIRPARPTRTVHPGVDLRRFDPSTLPAPSVCRAKLGLPSDGPLIGFVGRLQRWKGVHLLIDAMPAILAAHPDAHCVIVGGEHAFEPDYPGFLRERITHLGLAHRITLAGLQANVPEWMNAMDVFVHASDAEPFGMVVIEAMALGKPTLATATAGPLEIISDGVDGMLFPPGDVDGLTRAVLRYLDDPTFAAGVASRARSRAAAFEVSRYAEGVATALQSFRRDKEGERLARPSNNRSGTSPLRVALVMPLALRRGGCETQLINLLTANSALDRARRVDYSICFLEHGPMVDEVRSLGYPVHVIDAGRLRHAFRFTRTVVALTSWFREHHATHAVSWMEKAHLYASPAATIVGIPSAWWLRSIDRESRALALINRCPAAHVFACSHAALGALHASTLPQRAASVCYSSVDLARFDPSTLPSAADARRKLGLPSDRPIVGIVARLQRWKGIDILHRRGRTRDRYDDVRRGEAILRRHRRRTFARARRASRTPS